MEKAIDRPLHTLHWVQIQIKVRRQETQIRTFSFNSISDSNSFVTQMLCHCDCIVLDRGIENVYSPYNAMLEVREILRRQEVAAGVWKEIKLDERPDLDPLDYKLGKHRSLGLVPPAPKHTPSHTLRVNRR